MIIFVGVFFVTRAACVNPDDFHFLSQTGVDAKTFGDFAELLIPCPQKRGRIDKDRGY